MRKIRIYDLVEDARGRIQRVSTLVAVKDIGRVTSTQDILDDFDQPTGFIELRPSGVVVLKKDWPTKNPKSRVVKNYVIIREELNPYNKRWEAVAVFPQESASAVDDSMVCFNSREGHSGCSLRWYWETRPAGAETRKKMLSTLKKMPGYENVMLVEKFKITTKDNNIRRGR